MSAVATGTHTPSLVRLMAWLSPVFPTGGFAYSAGLEQAVADGLVRDETSLQTWLTALVERGSIWNEAVLIAAAYNQVEPLDALSSLAEALAPSAERHDEAIDQGAAFLDAARAWGDYGLPRTTPLPIALGRVCAHAEIPKIDAISAALQTLLSNQLQAAIRLSLIGQSGAARLLAALEPTLVATADRASQSTMDDLGGCTFLADTVSARHETLEPRLFLS